MAAVSRWRVMILNKTGGGTGEWSLELLRSNEIYGDFECDSWREYELTSLSEPQGKTWVGIFCPQFRQPIVGYRSLRDFGRAR